MHEDAHPGGRSGDGPPAARVADAPRPLAAIQSIARGFYRIVGSASAIGGAAVLVAPALTPRASAVGVLWLSFAGLALYMRGQAWAARTGAVLGLSVLMVLEVMAVAALQGWGIDGAGLPFLLVPVFAVAVLCTTAQALALTGLAGLGILSLFMFGPGGALQAEPLHPSALTRLSGLVMALGMATALGLSLGRVLAQLLQGNERLFLHYRNLFNRVPVAIVLHQDDRVIDANDRAVRLFGAEGRRTFMATGLSQRFSAQARLDLNRQCASLAESAAGAATGEVVLPALDAAGHEFLVRATTSRSAAAPDNTLLTILTDERERQSLEDALRRAKESAEAASRAKSSFLANTSHEIRTPLNGIIGLLDMARDPTVDEPTRQKYLAMMADSAQSLQALLSDVLDLSRIEAGKLHVAREPLNLLALLNALVDSHRVLAEAKGLALLAHCEVDPGLMVRADALRLRQVLGNLLNNAIKFTAVGFIRLSAIRRIDGLTLIEIEDTGIGIPPAAQGRLFEPFSQADASTARLHGGTGLGLSICRELITLMDGRIGVHSRPGRGSRFWVELPLEAVSSADSAPAAPATDRAGPSAAFQNLRVLVVDDNPVNLMIATFVLERHGATVTAVNAGDKALAAVTQAQSLGADHHLVLMDLQMPGMDGYQVAQRLRDAARPFRGPIVALTASALPDEIEQALKCGMQGVLTKPLAEEELLRTVGALLQESGLRR